MPRLLDLFCKAGGAGMGYHQAGFEVVGVDLEPQPRYPFRFIKRDALDALADRDFLAGFQVVHASPPCWKYTKLQKQHRRPHVDLVGPVRELLQMTGLPYVIENVPGAPLIDPVQVCGSALDLGVRRHRLFESNVPLVGTACRHHEQGPVISVNGQTGGRSTRDGSAGRGTVTDWRRAMDIAWMTAAELTQAIPPAYTAYLGHQLRAHTPDWGPSETYLSM